MDVSNPITAAVPGVTGLVVVALLPTTAPQSEAQLARRCDASRSGVRKALQRMTSSGVVSSVPGGYVLNREHLVFPALELLGGLHGKLRRRIETEAQEWGRPIECLGLFGSSARRDGDIHSDIDVLLVSDHPDSEDFAIDLGKRIEQWTGNDGQVIAHTAKEVRRMARTNEPIVRSWKRDLDPITGSLDEVLSPGLNKS